MKRATFTILIITLMFSLVGCSKKQSKEETPNPILEKIYIINTSIHERTFDFSFLKFYDDNTFQGVKTDSYTRDNATKELKPNFVSYYGTYEIDKNALTLNISDDCFSGAIINNGDTINFGNDTFNNWTEHIKSDDPLLSEFHQ